MIQKERVCILEIQTMFQDAFMDKMPEGLDEESGPAWIEEKYGEYLKGFDVCEYCSDGQKRDDQDCLFFSAGDPARRAKE
jgi:hypothetical protein